MLVGFLAQLSKALVATPTSGLPRLKWSRVRVVRSTGGVADFTPTTAMAVAHAPPASANAASATAVASRGNDDGDVVSEESLNARTLETLDWARVLEALSREVRRVARTSELRSARSQCLATIADPRLYFSQ